jgi:ubiquinone/menaquinone biosynthesis C-methylase UbiE
MVCLTGILDYKKQLIELLGDTTDNYILDYGCGRGDFIELLLNTANKPKQIWAIDSNKEMIDGIQSRFAQEINDGKVIAKIISVPNELDNYKFDKVICQNVLECVEDKLVFINAFKHLIKPSGIIILSHHDFDSAIYNSEFKELSRNLVHQFADSQQEWQKQADGQMGRKIPGLLAKSVFSNHSSCQTFRLVERTFKSGDYGYLMAQMVIDCGKNKFSKQEMLAWLEDLETKDKRSEYYFAIDLVVGKIDI